MAPQSLLIAIPTLDAGGPDRVVHELLHGLPRDRYRLTLLVQRAGGRYFEALPDDVAVEVVGDRSRYPARAFARAVDRLQPDLILTTLRMNVTAALAQLWQRRRVALIARQANAMAVNFRELRRISPIKQRLAEPVIRYALRRADVVIAQSQDMATELRGELGYDLRRQHMVVTIGNPVDLAAIDAACTDQQRSRPPLPHGDPAIVAIGRLSAQKGFDLLLAAFAIVARRHPAARLTIYGEGPDRAALDAQAAALGIAHQVAMPGVSAHILAQLAAADLFVSSSRYEGFSNALLEAMALGRCVVASDCPGATRELLNAGATGFLAAPDDPAGLAAAMLDALASDRAAIGTAARAFVGAQFGRAAIIGRYASLFDDVLSRRGYTKLR